MKHVQLELDAGGRESGIHPMFDVLMNAPSIERATALQGNGRPSSRSSPDSRKSSPKPETATESG